MNWSRSRLAKVFYFLVAAPLVVVVLSALPQHAAPKIPAAEIVLGIDPAQSKVRWALSTTLHTVHGTFAFKNGTFHVDPASGKAGGEIQAKDDFRCDHPQIEGLIHDIGGEMGQAIGEGGHAQEALAL